MNKVALFEKVSFEQFKNDYVECFGDEIGLLDAYDSIKLPKRATSGSAGYDFYCPAFINLNPGKGKKVPTGVRVKIAEGYVLLLMPKSGLGTKNRLQLDNTVGVIDSDYYYSSNEGHILVALRNNYTTDGLKNVVIEQGKAFVQGVFLQFALTVDDHAEGIRDGGFGSTEV